MPPKISSNFTSAKPITEKTEKKHIHYYNEDEPRRTVARLIGDRNTEVFKERETSDPIFKKLQKEGKARKSTRFAIPEGKKARTFTDSIIEDRANKAAKAQYLKKVEVDLPEGSYAATTTSEHPTQYQRGRKSPGGTTRQQIRVHGNFNEDGSLTHMVPDPKSLGTPHSVSSLFTPTPAKLSQSKRSSDMYAGLTPSKMQKYEEY